MQANHSLCCFVSALKVLLAGKTATFHESTSQLAPRSVPSRPSLEHDLAPEVLLLGGVVAHAHLQHPFGLHHLYELHVSLFLMEAAASVSRPAQGSVLPEDSAHSVVVVAQCHRSLNSKPLLVVPHEGAMADPGA